MKKQIITLLAALYFSTTALAISIGCPTACYKCIYGDNNSGIVSGWDMKWVDGNNISKCFATRNTATHWWFPVDCNPYKTAEQMKSETIAFCKTITANRTGLGIACGPDSCDAVPMT